MNIFKQYILTAFLGALTLTPALALMPAETAMYFNGPTVTWIAPTSAQVTLSTSVLNNLTDEEKSRVYFQYIEKDLVCIAIYPTPAACLPKKTELGKTDVTLTDLKQKTTYTVVYKLDNTIRCITAPCPSNEFQSIAVEFTTQSDSVLTPSPTVEITKNLFIGSRGEQVTSLQTFLIQKGHMRGTATGYFGVVTFQAVRDFQKANNIISTGFVGVLTRAAISASVTTSPEIGAERFQGTITAYSTQCFVDGECSITVDGKKIVTTTGWSQQTVGTVTGIPDFGSIESKVGSRANVYAKKTATGYTLYGSTEYYVHIQ